MQQDSSPQPYRPRGQPSSNAAGNGSFTAEQAATLIARQLATRTPKKFDGRCPYVGPVSFSEADARLYFGRENLIDELLDRTGRERFIAVVGSEGVGKTSLLNAGLVFGLRNGALMDSDKWLIHRFTPGDDPLKALAEACAALGERAGLASVVTDAIKKRGLTGPNALNELVDMLLGADKYRRAVLIIDQFEEAFTKAKDSTGANDARAFISFLTQASQNPTSRAVVVIGLRSEFLANCDAHPELKTALAAHTLRLMPLEDAELARAIVLPVLETGAQVEPQLVARLIADVQGDPTLLPKLQLALRDLFLALPSKPGKDKVLTLVDYLDFGPLRKREHDTLPAPTPVLTLDQSKTKAPLREALGEARAVSHFAEQEARMRRMKFVTALAGALALLALAGGIIGAFVGNQATQRANASASSEATAQAGAATAVVNASISDLGRVAAEAESTIAAQERKVALATNSVAEAAATQAAQTQQAATNLQGTAQAIATQGAGDVRNGAVAQATVSAIATASGALVQEAFATREAVEVNLKDTRSREWAAVALNQIGTDPQLAFLLAVEAEKLQHTQQSEDAVRRAAVFAVPDMNVFKVGSPVNDARFSPDGKLLVTAGRDGRAVVWDIASGQVLTALRAHVGAVNAAVFSADGARLATAGADRTARVWDLATARSVIVLSGHTGAVNGVDFLQDGKLIVSGSADKTARVWDIATGKPITVPIQSTGIVSSVLFVDINSVWLAGDAGLQEWNWNTSQFIQDIVLADPPIGTVTNLDISNPQMPRASIYDLPYDIVLTGHAQPPTQIWLSPDNRLVATTSTDNTVRLHDVYLDQLVGDVQSRLNRQLTCEERVRYLNEEADCIAQPTATPTK